MICCLYNTVSWSISNGCQIRELNLPNIEYGQTGVHAN
jgi:hypothetical protein